MLIRSPYIERSIINVGGFGTYYVALIINERIAEAGLLFVEDGHMEDNSIQLLGHRHLYCGLLSLPDRVLSSW